MTAASRSCSSPRLAKLRLRADRKIAELARRTVRALQNRRSWIVLNLRTRTPRPSSARARRACVTACTNPIAKCTRGRHKLAAVVAPSNRREPASLLVGLLAASTELQATRRLEPALLSRGVHLHHARFLRHAARGGSDHRFAGFQEAQASVARDLRSSSDARRSHERKAVAQTLQETS